MTRTFSRKQVSWGVLSHGVNMLVNLSFSLLVARQSSSNDYGRWSLLFLVIIFSVGYARSVIGTLIITNRAGENIYRKCLIASLVIAGLLMIVGRFIAPAYPAMTAVMAACIPLVVYQECRRSEAFASNRTKVAFASDLIWLIAFLIPTIILGLQHLLTDPVLPSALWGIAGLLSLLPFLGKYQIDHHDKDQLTEVKSLTALVSETTVGFIGSSSAPIIAANFASLSAAGSIRGAYTVMGFSSGINAALSPFLLMWLSRRKPSIKDFGKITLFCAGHVLVMGTLLYFIPPSWGGQMMGRTWAGIHDILIPIVAQSIAGAPLLAGSLILKSLGKFGATAILFTIQAALTVTCVFIAALVAPPEHTTSAIVWSTVLATSLTTLCLLSRRIWR